jgi:hypothetical protein
MNGYTIRVNPLTSRNRNDYISTMRSSCLLFVVLWALRPLVANSLPPGFVKEFVVNSSVVTGRWVSWAISQSTDVSVWFLVVSGLLALVARGVGYGLHPNRRFHHHILYLLVINLYRCANTENLSMNRQATRGRMENQC